MSEGPVAPASADTATTGSSSLESPTTEPIPTSPRASDARAEDPTADEQRAAEPRPDDPPADDSRAGDPRIGDSRNSEVRETVGRDGDGRDTDPSSDERSQRLIRTGTSSPRNWPDSSARDTFRNEAAAGAAPASGYSSAGGTGSVAGSSAGVSSVAPAGAAVAQGGVSRSTQTRRARLRISHVDPLSVMRLALLFGACMLVVLLVAVAALWFVLNAAGVFSSITEATSTITDNSSNGTSSWFSFGRVMLITAVLGVINVIAFTLLSTVGALLYNLCSDFVGGVEVTLSER